MNNQDPALTCSSPALIAAVYFGLLSVVGTILIDDFLSFIGIKEIIPLFEAIILGMIVASCTGAICGKAIIHCVRPYKKTTFLIGFFMVLASIPFFDLGFLLLIKKENLVVLSFVQNHNIIYSYCAILIYSYLLFGIALAIGAGLLAMYLRGQFVYDLLGTYQPTVHIAVLPSSPVEKNRIQHADNVSIKHKDSI